MTVSEQIIQVLNALCEKFGLVIDWTSENVIPYLGELCGKLVNYEIWTSVAWMAVMMLLSIISGLCAKKLLPIAKEKLDEFDYPIVTIITVIVVATLCFATIIVVGTQIFDIVKCVTFPEMYIFEYVKGMIDNMQPHL